MIMFRVRLSTYLFSISVGRVHPLSLTLLTLRVNGRHRRPASRNINDMIDGRHFSPLARMLIRQTPTRRLLTIGIV